jgi:hypothetical protein
MGGCLSQNCVTGFKCGGCTICGGEFVDAIDALREADDATRSFEDAIRDNIIGD